MLDLDLLGSSFSVVLKNLFGSSFSAVLENHISKRGVAIICAWLCSNGAASYEAMCPQGSEGFYDANETKY